MAGRSLVAILPLLLTALVASDLAAQTRAPDGTRLPYVEVRISPDSTGQLHTRVTGAAGKMGSVLELIEGFDAFQPPLAIDQGAPPTLGWAWNWTGVAPWVTVDRIEISAKITAADLGNFGVFVSSESELTVSPEVEVFASLPGTGTDGGRDDDAEDDADIEFDWRQIDAFNGERAAQVWGFAIYDLASQGTGSVEYLGIRIYHQDICEVATTVPEGDCTALHDLYLGTGGDAWTTRTNWLQQADPCSWFGVTCLDGRVSALELPDNALSAMLPPTFSNLTALSRLVLPNNSIGGTFPPQVLELQDLAVLDLENAQLTGGLPASIGDLVNLTFLGLRGNQHTGVLPLAVARLCAAAGGGTVCTFQDNASLCVPTLPDYVALGVDPLGGLPLSADCGNQAPTAVDDDATTPFETAIDIPVLANDTDADADPISVTGIARIAAHGTTIVVGDGQQVRYTPDPDFWGADSFEYTVADAQGLTSNATVTVVVEVAPNAPPVAIDDAAQTAIDTAVRIAVLANDSDLDGDRIQITGIAAVPTSGTVSTIDAGQALLYTPDAGFQGIDAFRYTIQDGRGGAATGAVTVQVGAAPNSSPVAMDDEAMTPAGTPVDIPVLSNDSDPDGDILTVSSIAQAATGGAAVISGSGSSVRYTPDAGFSGPDLFRYVVSDGRGGSDEAVVTVTVSPPINVPPLALVDRATTEPGAPVTIDVLANDHDADGDVLMVQSVTTAPGTGSSAPSADQSAITYTPAAGFLGTESFRYLAADGRGGTSQATVIVTVTSARNRAPFARDDAASADSGGQIDIAVLANDGDPDDDAVRVTALVRAPASGTASVLQDGLGIRYVPQDGFSGTDDFVYRIGDGRGGSDDATATIVVGAAASTAPTARDDAVVSQTFVPLDIQVTANDDDADGDLLAILAIDPLPAGGAAVVHPGGRSVRYQSNEGFTGQDTFGYRVTDGRGGTAQANVVVQVVADPLVAGTVTFRVDMTRELTLTNLGPNDVVGVIGGADPLHAAVPKQLGDADRNGVYEGTVGFMLPLGTPVSYRFSFGPATGRHIEGAVGPADDGSRTFDYAGDTILDSVHWNNVEGTGNASPSEIPEGHLLLEVYPNPVRRSARVEYTTAEAGHVKVDLFDSLGRRVRRLQNSSQTAGRHELELSMAGLPAGIYLLSVQVANRHITRIVARVR